MTPIKTALLAYGLSGKIFHAPFLATNEGFELYAVLERNTQKAKNDFPDVKSYVSLEELLVDDTIELVVVNTPNNTHFELAKQLSDLRYKGILIVGSGNIVHNLRLVDFSNFDKDNYGYDWAIEARETINNYVLDGNFKPLFDYEKHSKALQLAIPTPEHFLPLIYTLGLKDKKDQLHLFNDKLVAGSLSMTSVKIS